MKHSVLVACIVGLAAATGGSLVAHAGAEKIAFPANFASGVLYATIDRPDAKQQRELYASAEAVKAALEGKPMPHGTVITEVLYRAVLDSAGNPTRDANGRFQKGDVAGYVVMEKRAGWGVEYPDELRNGEWEYAVFTADRQLNPKPKANLKACFECHKPHSKADFVMSAPMLAGGQVTVKPVAK
jgi:hypothetical protein